MYRSLFCMGALLSLSLFAIGPIQGQAPEIYVEGTGGKRATMSELDGYLLHLMDSLQMPGLSIAIINDANIVYQRAFGVANRDTGEKVTERTLFEGASLSKPIFAYFVMKIVQKGLLDLDRPLYKYMPIPELTVAPSRVTDL